MKKRLVRGAVLAAVIICSLAGCGKGVESGGVTTSNSAETTSKPAETTMSVDTRGTEGAESVTDVETDSMESESNDGVLEDNSDETIDVTTDVTTDGDTDELWNSYDDTDSGMDADFLLSLTNTELENVKNGDFTLGVYAGEVDSANKILEMGLSVDESILYMSMPIASIPSCYIDRSSGMVYYYDENDREWYLDTSAVGEMEEVADSLEKNAIDFEDGVLSKDLEHWMGDDTVILGQDCYTLYVSKTEEGSSEEVEYYISKDTWHLVGFSTESGDSSLGDRVTMTIDTINPVKIPEEALSSKEGDIASYIGSFITD